MINLLDYLALIEKRLDEGLEIPTGVIECLVDSCKQLYFENNTVSIIKLNEKISDLESKNELLHTQNDHLRDGRNQYINDILEHLLRSGVINLDTHNYFK